MSDDPRTYAIIGAAMEVHSHLGPGLLEGVYQHALAVELERRGISFRQQVELPVLYKGTRLACSYRADFVCVETVVVEIKVLRSLSGTEEAQVINYLRATGLETALLLNFGATRLTWERFAHNPHLRPSATSADL